MFSFFAHIFGNNNPVTTSGLVLMLVGGIGVFLRSLPEYLWSIALEQTTMTITVKDDDAAFQWVKEWLMEQAFLKRVRRVDLDTTLRGRELALLPAPGTHFVLLQGRPFWITFSRSDETKGRAMRRTESLTFRTLGRQQKFLRGFVDEVVASHRRSERMVSTLHCYDDYWARVESYSPRLLDSVILRDDEKGKLVNDIGSFLESRERYRHLGIPYHRGYLFYGPPGTGKTSLVAGIASHFGLSIYMLNLTEMNDRTLKAAIHEIPEHSIILMEDIDCMQIRNRGKNIGNSQENTERSGGHTSGVTLSGLLNVLDGFHAPENVLYAMTTNEISALDPALLRPGRIDYKLFLGTAGQDQQESLYRRFFPNATDTDVNNFLLLHATSTMAEIQNSLLFKKRHYLSGDKCLENQAVMDEVH